MWKGIVQLGKKLLSYNPSFWVPVPPCCGWSELPQWGLQRKDTRVSKAATIRRWEKELWEAARTTSIARMSLASLSEIFHCKLPQAPCWVPSRWSSPFHRSLSRRWSPIPPPWQSFSWPSVWRNLEALVLVLVHLVVAVAGTLHLDLYGDFLELWNIWYKVLLLRRRTRRRRRRRRTHEELQTHHHRDQSVSAHQ